MLAESGLWGLSTSPGAELKARMHSQQLIWAGRHSSLTTAELWMPRPKYACETRKQKSNQTAPFLCGVVNWNLCPSS